MPTTMPIYSDRLWVSRLNLRWDQNCSAITTSLLLRWVMPCFYNKLWLSQSNQKWETSCSIVAINLPNIKGTVLFRTMMLCFYNRLWLSQRNLRCDLNCSTITLINIFLSTDPMIFCIWSAAIYQIFPLDLTTLKGLIWVSAAEEILKTILNSCEILTNKEQTTSSHTWSWQKIDKNMTLLIHQMWQPIWTSRTKMKRSIIFLNKMNIWSWYLRFLQKWTKIKLR